VLVNGSSSSKNQIMMYGTIAKTKQFNVMFIHSSQLLPSQTNEFWDRIRATIRPEGI
jgi:hypothetical protein